ncbi:MAG: hypothetical protein ACRD2G_07485 [Terriglobia bacterium]
MTALPVGSRHCCCRACGEYFGGVTGFEMHRRGEYSHRYCINPATAGLTKDGRGYWRRLAPDMSKFHDGEPNSDDFSTKPATCEGLP